MEDFCRRRHGAILLGLLILGLGLRAYHYLTDPPMWHDEANQVVNILDKSFAELQGPLFFAEASPPGFMWLIKGWTLVFGDGTLALRFLPWLTSCLALAGMTWLGHRWLPRSGALVLTLLFACSDRLLWHCCETKPYAVDVLVSVGLMMAMINWTDTGESAPERWRWRRRLLLLAGLSPALLFVSFPACFVLGALVLGWLPMVWRQRDMALWSCYGVFVLALGGAFLWLLWGPIRAQHVDALHDYWADNLPRWQQPWTIPYDLLRHVTEVFRYASEPVGNLLVVMAIVGGFVLWRQGQRRLLGLLVLPLALNSVAWLLGRYLMGALRVNVYLAPPSILLVAFGFRATWFWLRQRLGTLGPALATSVVLVPLAVAGYRLVHPWSRLDSREPAQFVLQHRHADEPVVGTMWEHCYYFRSLEGAFRLIPTGLHDPPTAPPTSAIAATDQAYARYVWVVANSRDFDPRRVLTPLEPIGGWVIREQHRFRTMTAFRLERAGGASSTTGN